MRHAAPSVLTLRPVPPFRLDLTVWALRRRPRNAIDRWDGTAYRRVVVVAGRRIELAMRQSGSPASPRLLVTMTPPPRTPSDRRGIRLIVERLLGVRVDLADWYRLARRNPRLKRLAEQFRGMKPPRFPTMFEALVNAFACQQLSLEVGLELLNRLAAVCDVTSRADDAHYGFPDPADVARLPPARYQAIGFSRQKVRALLMLARAAKRRDIDLEALARETDSEACAQLRQLRGVGRWTAEYALLRGLGRLHVFPGDDVGAQKRLARWLGRSSALDYVGVRRAVSPWQPYAGLVYFHLLLDGLSQAGVLEDSVNSSRGDQ
jgi:DNA-3-methyladenine glycosylase II